ncbi:MAG: YraN family protein [Pseudomonadota bacterium]
MSKGELAEQTAARYLQQQGLKLLQRNYRCRGGEIDLILQDRDTLVSAEVRLRSGHAFGGAAASITRTKQQRLILAAQHYLAGQHRLPPCRFDAVLMETPEGGGLQWVKHAFDT